MKILLLNLGLYGSTGSIVLDLKEQIEKAGHQARLAYPEVHINRTGFKDDIVIKGVLSRKINHFLEKLTGFQGCFSWFKTIKLIRDIKEYEPELIHVHILHKVNLNLGMLFRYFKESNIPIVWTFHDCWAFTGQCPHFTMVKCDKWKTGCYKCPQYKNYPEVWVDRTKAMWRLKKKWFTSVKDMIIVTPSQWLADLVKQSFLKEYPVRVINNGIDLEVFRPRKSNFRDSYNIGDRKMILGVAAQWNERKGIDVFIELSKQLDKCYVIVLVGTNDDIDRALPPNIISIHATTNREELAEIYTVADVFVNPTREDNFPTVNLEALACGTPVITFDTGGSPESLDDTCGIVVPCGDVDGLIQQIRKICFDDAKSRDDCLKKVKIYDKDKKYKAYLNLYKEQI